MNDYQKEIVIQMVKGEALKDVPMKEFTTLRIGGNAELLVFPRDIAALRGTILFASENQIPYLILGNGSKLLVKDKGFSGILISLQRGFNSMGLIDNLLQVQAGCNLKQFIDFASEQCRCGPEHLIGIPGTVGGALFMNAGAFGKEIGEFVHSLQVMERDGNIEEFKREYLKFSYRSLCLQKDSVILSALFQLPFGEKREIEMRKIEFLKKRHATQPDGAFSAGCIFKNPPGMSAGKLIEEVGLKGIKVGDARISTVHANFIINSGKATAKDVLKLIELVKKRVYEEKGIELELELQVIGED